MHTLCREKLRHLKRADAAVKIVQNRRTEGIIHDRIQRRAQCITSPAAIAFLQHRVFPDLAQDQAVRFFLLCRAADQLQNFIGKLIRHIQPPAGCPTAKPLAHDGVFPRHDEILPGGIRLLYLRQFPKAPPASIVVREMPKVVPAVIGRGLILTGAGFRVMTVTVKIDAVRPRVRKHAVTEDPDSKLGRRLTEGGEVLVRSEDRIHPQIVRGVVSMVGARLDNRIEIQAAYAKILEVRKALSNAPQGPAVEVIGNIVLLKGPRLPAYLLFPGGMQFRRLTETLMIVNSLSGRAVVGEGEAVRKDLVQDTALKPRRCLEAPRGNREAESVLCFRKQPGMQPVRRTADPERHVPAGRPDAEAIPERGGDYRCRELKRPALFTGGHGEFFAEIVAPEFQHGLRHTSLLRLKGETQLFSGRHRAAGKAAVCKPDIMEDRRNIALEIPHHLKQVAAARLKPVQLLHLFVRQVFIDAGRHIGIDGLQIQTEVIHQDPQELRRKNRSDLFIRREPAQISLHLSGTEKPHRGNRRVRRFRKETNGKRAFRKLAF